MNDEDAEFYVNLYLEYCQNVDEMAQGKKIKMLFDLLKNSETTTDINSETRFRSKSEKLFKKYGDF
jgi:hypothetical protein